MNIFHNIQDFKPNKNTVATLGTFDGVHLGHKKIIERLTQEAEKSNTESLVLTFFPHPRMVLQGNSVIQLLNTIREKAELLENIGLQNLIIHPFDESFSQLSAEEFVKTILVDQFQIKKIIIGHDHRFGKNRSADINDLIAYGKIYDFEVEQISAQEIDEVSISSTKIRKALMSGDIQLANEYLGYNYFITGTVVKGRQLGRTIGFPTANLKIEEEYKLIPLNGVYIVKSHWNGKEVFGMMNIGTNPTVDGKERTIETNFLDLEEDLYGKEMRIYFLQRIRSEEKFDSIDTLKAAIENDKIITQSFIKSLK
ncbi:bifunctional riboflavin kinase/FAD synthetase [Flavobacterium lindanitolerans]|uniref:Riboflavin biosynthesis protein n=1 Tax=Flavobacterium lindanitolerans TaxID=428988 RepID=A0A497V958_9FLAO|nr:bifunctional riboflavin kinase/FAD synthetase [Flavobacterium lindanitolerans]PKW28699.1 riboflavin kinase/FMN adenylyltransferase [Flavobacterium lindanitolerans]RLJ35796.1 riboflavin kinase/FMN adenylyltransferase [Flavobacterium lindanitolerans]